MYIDGFVAAVPDANRDAYRAHAEKAGAILKEHGMQRMVECWGDDVPDGKLTSFPMAVKKQDGETVVFSWVIWPDKATRDLAWKAVMDDPRMDRKDNPIPFDAKRMIYGGFDVLVDI